MMNTVDGVGKMAELLSKYEYGTVGIALIFVVFIYMIFYITKNLNKKFEEVLIEMKILQNLIMTENLDNLTAEASKNIIKNQVYISKHELIDEILLIYTENDIKNPVRQAIITERFSGFIKNSIDRDLDMLSKMKFKDNKLSYYVSENYKTEVILKPLLKMMFTMQMSKTDVHKEINMIYYKIINYSKELINEIN